MTTCAECKWFKKGNKEILDLYVLAAAYNTWPTGGDIVTAGVIGKDGKCTFNPDAVSKRKTDSCGQFEASS